MKRLELQSLCILKHQKNSTGNLVAAAQKCHIKNKIFIYSLRLKEQNANDPPNSADAAGFKGSSTYC